MRLPDENGGKDRRATFDDVGDHNVTTKTILGARVRQQVGVPHGAHHRRILEGGKKRGMRGPITRKAPARGVPGGTMIVRQGSGVAQASGPNPMSFPGVNSS